MLARINIAFLILYCTLQVRAQDSMARHYKIYDTRIQKEVSTEQIITAVTEADVLFFGEEHSDSIGHYLEQYLFKALHTVYGKKTVLSLEMFETDGQLVLNEYLGGQIDETRFTKDIRLWSNYKDYRPLIEFAKQNRIPVIAANPPRRYVSMVSRKGMDALNDLSKEAKRFLPPLPYDTADGAYRNKFFELLKGAPETQKNTIYHSQNLWDAGMSYSIHRLLKKHKGRKVFHCVGRFHTDEKLGMAAQLKKRNSKLRILNISCFPDTAFANPDWTLFRHLGDFIIITDPAVKPTF